MFNLAEFKKFFLFNLIGSLIVSALVAVVTVLIGEFNSTSAKVLFTLFMVVVHSLISLSFIWDNERQNTFERLPFFINVLFFLIVLSFITSIFGIWDIVSGKLVWHLYETYFILGFAALHADILSKALGREKYLDVVVYINYVFMAIVVLLLLTVVYVDNATVVLGEFFYRILGAAGIVDGTLSILAIIFFKLYLHNHPEDKSPITTDLPATPGAPKEAKRKGLSVWVWVLVVYLVFQIGMVLYSNFRY